MWEFEELQRNGRTIIILYKMPPGTSEVERVLHVRGQVECRDDDELNQWRTLLQTLNSTQE